MDAGRIHETPGSEIKTLYYSIYYFTNIEIQRARTSYFFMCQFLKPHFLQCDIKKDRRHLHMQEAV